MLIMVIMIIKFIIIVDQLYIYNDYYNIRVLKRCGPVVYLQWLSYRQTLQWVWTSCGPVRVIIVLYSRDVNYLVTLTNLLYTQNTRIINFLD